MQKFEIFYENGEKHSGWTDVHWAKMPNNGVQVVIVLNGDNSQQKIRGYDFYWLDGETIKGGNERPAKGLVKTGTTIPDDQFATLMSGLEANSDIWNY